MKKTIALLTVSITAASMSNAAVIYNMDFSVAGQGSTHDTSGTDPVEAAPINGQNWTLTYNTPSSDGTTNSFITSGGAMLVDDWGGLGTVTSDPINITQNGSFTLAGAASVTDFNSSAEGMAWFYTINGTETEFGTLGQGFGGANVTGTQSNDISAFSAVNVSSGDVVTVGFKVNVNGAGDGATISSMSLDFEPVPEPSTALLGGLGFLALARRKR